MDEMTEYARLRKMDMQIARALGFTVRTEDEVGYLAFIHREWEQEWIEIDNEEVYLPHYTTDLQAAWTLHRHSPPGVILFNEAWLTLEPRAVARNISEAFIRSWLKESKP